MKEETANKLVKAFERGVLYGSGHTNADAAVGEYIGFLERLLSNAQKFRRMEDVRRDLLAMEEPSVAQVAMVEAMAYWAPLTMIRLLRGGAFAFLKKTAANGRPEVLTTQQRCDVRDSILSQMRDGSSLRQAKRKVARSLGVSTRTITRTWNGRAELPPSGISQADAEEQMQRLVESAKHDSTNSQE